MWNLAFRKGKNASRQSLTFSELKKFQDFFLCDFQDFYASLVTFHPSEYNYMKLGRNPQGEGCWIVEGKEMKILFTRLDKDFYKIWILIKTETEIVSDGIGKKMGESKKMWRVGLDGSKRDLSNLISHSLQDSVNPIG